MILCMGLLLLAAIVPLRAQPPSSAGGNNERARFQLVGTTITDVDIARDSLLLDYVRFYHTGSVEEMLRVIAAPRDPFEERASRFYRRALERGFRVIAPLPGLGLDPRMMRVLESYARVDPGGIDNLPLYDVHGGAPYDTLLHGLAFGITVEARPGGGDALVAGRPSYLAQNVFHRGNEKIYGALGLPDRSTWFRVGVTIAVDTADPAFIAMPDSALLGYIHLYRRVRSGQEPCRCNIYEKYDSLPVTRRAYLAAEPAEGGYRDLGWTLDFARGVVVVPRDTVEQFLAHQDNLESWWKTYPTGTDTLALLDTLPGRMLGARVDTLTWEDDLSGEYLRGVRFDTIQRYHVMLAEQRADAWQYGSPGAWFGYAPGSCESFCDSLIRSGRFGPNAVREYVEAGDFDMKLYSTRRLPMRFLRTRINQDLYDLLRRGALDTLIGRAVARFQGNDTIRRLFGMVAFDDETTHPTYRPHGELSRRLGRAMRERGLDSLGIWANPQANFDGFRALTGDLDSGGHGTVRMIVRQDYNQIGALDDPIPIAYPNPDSMSWWGAHRIYSTDTLLRSNGAEERLRWSLIAPNSLDAYRAYNARRQRSFGSSLDARSQGSVKQGALLPTLGRAVAAAKFGYREIGYREIGAEPVQVWNSIQDMGWQTEAQPRRQEPGGAYNAWGLRPPTAEEIAAQVWLSLNCGVDGLVYADAQYDGVNFGFVHALDGSHAAEYASVLPANITAEHTREDLLALTQPLMWTGFRSRFDVVRRLNREIRLLDSILVLREMRFDREQLSLSDPRADIRGIPLLDTVVTRQARRHRVGRDGKYLDSSAVDPRGESWLEVSHFLPAPRDTHAGSHYYLFTNRRCWPVDRLAYGAEARAFGSGAVGLGAIDVRRPVITLGGAPDGRYLVEKVGHEAAWPSREIDAGEEIELDWLEPGWGAFYRVTPLGDE